MEQETLFKETQQFRQWWIWLILVFVLGQVVWITVMQLNAPAAGSKEDVLIPLLFLPIPAVIFIFMFSARLETEIRAEGIYVRFFPVHRKLRFYPWSEMESIQVRKYNPIGEYGGWGLRGLGKNRALNISGNRGLQLILKDRRRLLIGTQKPDELIQILNALPGGKQILKP